MDLTGRQPVGTDAELAGFAATITAFEEVGPGKQVELNETSYEQVLTTIDAQLQAGDPPTSSACRTAPSAAMPGAGSCSTSPHGGRCVYSTLPAITFRW